MKNKDQKLKTAISQSKFQRWVRPGGIKKGISIVCLGGVGAGLGWIGNFVAAIFAIVILIDMANEELDKSIIRTQREHIDLLQSVLWGEKKA